MITKNCFSMIIGISILISASANADVHDVFGTFFTKGNESKVKIEDCGNGSPCGKIIWVNPETIEEGRSPKDLRSKAGKPVIGLRVLKDFKRKKNDWRGGTIYHPGRDKTYASRIKKLDNGNLEVKGCIAFFCVTQMWVEEK